MTRGVRTLKLQNVARKISSKISELLFTCTPTENELLSWEAFT